MIDSVPMPTDSISFILAHLETERSYYEAAKSDKQFDDVFRVPPGSNGGWWSGCLHTGAAIVRKRITPFRRAVVSDYNWRRVGRQLNSLGWPRSRSMVISRVGAPHELTRRAKKETSQYFAVPY